MATRPAIAYYGDLLQLLKRDSRLREVFAEMCVSVLEKQRVPVQRKLEFFHVHLVSHTDATKSYVNVKQGV